MKPLVYIIILNFNGLEDTQACLESLKTVDYDNYKIIIVDNNSGVEEVEKLEKSVSENIQLIKSDTNTGFAGGNNIGIKKAIEQKAEYILLLNNDTVVDKDFINELVDPFKDTKVAITTSKIFYQDRKEIIWYAGANFNKFSGESIHLGEGQVDSEEFSETKEVERASGCSMMVKREVFEEIGLLDDKYFLLFEESEFCWRARAKGYITIFCSKSIIWHKVSSTTKSNSPRYIYYYKRNQLYFTKKYFSPTHWWVMFFYLVFESLIFITYWILMSEDKSGDKVKALYAGYSDFFRGNMGQKNI